MRTLYAVIGGQNPGVRSVQYVEPQNFHKYNGWWSPFFVRPFTVSAKAHPTWPIIMKCSSEREAFTACLAQGIIEGGIGFDASDEDTARFIFNSPSIRGLFPGMNETPFYPVYYAGNNGRIIYRTFEWAFIILPNRLLYYNLQPATLSQVAGAVNGVEKPIFRRVERFYEALVYMILRGRHASLNDYDFEKSPPTGVSVNHFKSTCTSSLLNSM